MAALDGSMWFSSQPTRGNSIVGYVYGRCAFEDIADAISTAFSSEHRIYLLAWSAEMDTPLKQTAAGSPPATLQTILSSTKAQVRTMFSGGLVMGQNVFVHQAINSLPNGGSVLDQKLPHLGVHHQKLLVVHGALGLIAFVGGMDIVKNRVQLDPTGWPGLPWHDVHLRITGPAALQCRDVFRDRWIDHPDSLQVDAKLGYSPFLSTEDRVARVFPEVRGAQTQISTVTASGQKNTRYAAVGRTFANLRKVGESYTYSFAKNGEYTAWQMIQHAINQAKTSIYLEDQYLISRIARTVLTKKITQPGFRFLLILITDSPSIPPNEIPYLVLARNEFRRDLQNADPSRSKWRIFSLKQAPTKERQEWCGSYVHSKTWIFDDEFAVVGSANVNNRGYTWDTEVVAGIADDPFSVAVGESFARELRINLWHKHLGVPHSFVSDWDKGLKLWKKLPPGAMVVDRSDYEVDPTSGARFESDLSKETADQIEFAWTHLIDPDGR